MEFMEFLLKIGISGIAGLLVLWIIGVLFINREIHLNLEDYNGVYTCLVQMYLMCLIVLLIFALIGGFVWNLL